MYSVKTFIWEKDKKKGVLVRRVVLVQDSLDFDSAKNIRSSIKNSWIVKEL